MLDGFWVPECLGLAPFVEDLLLYGELFLHLLRQSVAHTHVDLLGGSICPIVYLAILILVAS